MTEILAGKWAIEHELGGGGMGRVVKAHYLSSGYPCAIKFLLEEHRHDSELVERFINEAQLSNRIGHGGVCRIIDVGWTEAQLPFLVMEYLEGQTLEDLLEDRGGLIAIGGAIRITTRVLEVLCAAHEAKVLHRDIKPDNIYVARDGAIKLLDFGVARMPGSSITRAGSTLGTLGYMSPESALGTTMSSGFASDVWSVGVCLFRMLCGELPVDLEQHNNPLAAARAAATTPARRLSQLLPRCPAQLDEVVGRLLAFDPDQRYTAAEALASLRELSISPELIGQTAPFVWDPRAAARPRSARFISTVRSASLSQAEVLDEADVELLEELDELDSDELEPVSDTQTRARGHTLHRELLNDYRERGDLDSASSLAATMRFLGAREPEILALAQRRDGSFKTPRGRITRRHWREVVMAKHPSPQLSALLALLWPALAASRATAYAELLPSPPLAHPVSAESEGLPRWLAHLSAVLELPAPELYLTHDESYDLRAIAPTFDGRAQPSLLAGADALTPQVAAGLAFRCGFALAQLHPYLIAGTILPSSSRLRDAIYGATLLAEIGDKVPPESMERAQIWERLIAQQLSESQQVSLRRAVARVIRMGGDTKAWLRGCRASAARVGLLLCGDLDLAAELIRARGEQLAEEVVSELVEFSASEDYLQLRRRLFERPAA